MKMKKALAALAAAAVAVSAMATSVSAFDQWTYTYDLAQNVYKTEAGKVTTRLSVDPDITPGSDSASTGMYVLVYFQGNKGDIATGTNGNVSNRFRKVANNGVVGAGIPNNGDWEFDISYFKRDGNASAGVRQVREKFSVKSKGSEVGIYFPSLATLNAEIEAMDAAWIQQLEGAIPGGYVAGVDYDANANLVGWVKLPAGTFAEDTAVEIQAVGSHNFSYESAVNGGNTPRIVVIGIDDTGAFAPAADLYYDRHNNSGYGAGYNGTTNAGVTYEGFTAAAEVVDYKKPFQTGVSTNGGFGATFDPSNNYTVNGATNIITFLKNHPDTKSYGNNSSYLWVDVILNDAVTNYDDLTFDFYTAADKVDYTDARGYFYGDDYTGFSATEMYKAFGNNVYASAPYSNGNETYPGFQAYNWSGYNLFNAALVVNPNVTMAMQETVPFEIFSDHISFHWSNLMDFNSGATINPYAQWLSSLYLYTSDMWFWDKMTVTAANFEDDPANADVNDPAEGDEETLEEEIIEEEIIEEEIIEEEIIEEEVIEEEIIEEEVPVEEVPNVQTGNASVALAVIPVALAAAAIIAKKRG